MFKTNRKMGYTLALIIFLLAACSQKPDKIEVKHYPLDSLDGIQTEFPVALDKLITRDGNGALRLSTDRPTTLNLYETDNVAVDNGRLVYEADIRTEGVDGEVYLEMWCHFPGQGRYFSRAVQSPISGDQEWIRQETAFLLQEGETPDKVQLNLVVDGTGQVWIDDLHLTYFPFQ